MKIPDSVRIGGVEYPVSIKDNIRHDNALAYGHIDWDNCMIELSGTDGTAHEKRCMTLWHEILHGIAHHANLEIEDEENVVDTLANGIYQVLQDNGRRLFDIIPELIQIKETEK